MIFAAALILSISILSVNANAFSRKLTTEYNPNCGRLCTAENPPVHLVYTRGVSTSNKDDVMHYVITAGGKLGPLAVSLISANGRNSRLSFNWTRLLAAKPEHKKSIYLTGGTVVFKASYIFARLWQYNDTTDKANMSLVPPTNADNVSLWHRWDTDRFIWRYDQTKRTNGLTVVLSSNQTTPHPFPDMGTVVDAQAKEEAPVSNSSTTSAPNVTTTSGPNVTTTSGPNVTTTSAPNVTTTSGPNVTSAPTPAPHGGGLFRPGGSLEFRIVLSGEEERSEELPRLAFTGNSTQVDLTLNNLNASWPGARFGVTLVQMVSLNRDQGVMKVEMKESIDDEFSPGIFKMFNWVARPKKPTPSTQHDRAYLQWKPVCYTTSERHLKESQQMFRYALPNTTDLADQHVIDRSAAFGIFTTHMTPLYDAIPLNISFGQPGDGFYKATNYNSWTSSAGLGEPPADTVSLATILVIVIGLGLPAIFIVGGSIIICMRRRRQENETYRPIN